MVVCNKIVLETQWWFAIKLRCEIKRKLWIGFEIINDMLNEFTERNVSNISREGFQRAQFH